ncbi:DUF4376 domain-containing protein [Vibrio sp. TRT 21S02]|uniref:DUF4376 domain-containing protein n=1 Tax=Vibrio sp. TRT 21S02 TaxID=3418507 RepID=UPI003CF6D6C6
MSESLTLYVTSHKTGELLGQREAISDIKQPDRFVIPPYQTPVELPEDSLAENEYWAFLDQNDKPARDYTLGAWFKKKKYHEVTAYHKQTKHPKEFDDVSLVDNEHTINVPPPHSIWQSGNWVQQVDLLKEAKRKEINHWRDTQEANAEQKVVVSSIEWDAGPSDRIRIESTLAGDFIPPFWTDANDIDQPIGRDSLKAIHTAIVQRGFEIHARQREMKCEIETITDFSTLEAYQVDWPQV